MVLIAVKCPICQGTDVSKNGRTKTTDTQRYICNEPTCSGKSFLLDYRNKGSKPGIESEIIKMTSNASGVNDIVRVLNVSKPKVLSTLKKQKT